MLSVFCFFFHTAKKSPKTKQKTKPSNEVPRAWTCWFPNGAGADWQAPPSPRSCGGVGTNQSSCEHSHSSLLVFPPSSPLLSPVLYPSCLSAHWRYQKFQIFKAVSVFSVYMLGFYNGSWPEKVQHLPHTDIGPFPVLGISVFCWSNSESNFKMFSAAISWQDSTSFPMPWLIRGG